MLKLDDLRQEFDAVSGVLTDSKEGFDLGFGLFRNRVNFGTNQQTDQNGQPTEAIFDSYETSYALGMGVRLGMPVSLGGTFKFYDSRLAQGLGANGKSQGWAFDIGFLIDPDFHPLDPAGISSLEFKPSLGMLYQNIGPDNFYNEALQADPIPTTYRIGLCLTFSLADLLEIRASNDLEKEIPRWDFSADQQVVTTEYSLDFLGYRYAFGELSDPGGKRLEESFSNGINLNALRLWRIWHRIQTGDFKSAGESLEKGFPFPALSFGTRVIHSRDNGTRDQQKSFFLALSL